MTHPCPIDSRCHPGATTWAALAVHVVGNTDGCRWLDDGADHELIYFEGVTERDFTNKATQFKFMGSVSASY